MVIFWFVECKMSIIVQRSLWLRNTFIRHIHTGFKGISEGNKWKKKSLEKEKEHRNVPLPRSPPDQIDRIF